MTKRRETKSTAHLAGLVEEQTFLANMLGDYSGPQNLKLRLDVLLAKINAEIVEAIKAANAPKPERKKQ